MTHHKAKASFLLFCAFSLSAPAIAHQSVPSSIRSLFTRGEGQVVPSTKVFAPRADLKRTGSFFAGDGINAPVSELRLDELPKVERAEFVANVPAAPDLLQPKPLQQTSTNPVSTKTPAAAATQQGNGGCFNEGCAGCGGAGCDGSGGSSCNCGVQASSVPRRRLFSVGLQPDVPCKYGRTTFRGRIGEMTRRFRERRLIARRGRINQRLANLGTQCANCGGGGGGNASCDCGVSGGGGARSGCGCGGAGCGIGASSCAGQVVGAGVGAVGFGMHSFGCGFCQGVKRYDHCYDNSCGCDHCGNSSCGCGGCGRGIIASCRAIRNGVGRPFGDMPGHHPYDTYRNYYYYRPYNAVHYRDQQDCSGSMGFGTESQPYTGDAFERAYEETLQGTTREDKRYLEYSSSGGETWLNGNERYTVPDASETFFPETEPVDVEWEPKSYPTEIPLPAGEDSVPLSLESNSPVLPTVPAITDESFDQPYEPDTNSYPVEIPLPADEDSLPLSVESTPSSPTNSRIVIPDGPTDPAAIESPLFKNGAAGTTKRADDDKAIENLIDKLLPIEDPTTSQP